MQVITKRRLCKTDNLSHATWHTKSGENFENQLEFSLLRVNFGDLFLFAEDRNYFYCFQYFPFFAFALILESEKEWEKEGWRMKKKRMKK